MSTYDNDEQIRLSRESRYISNRQYRADKARLTRALNKGDLDGILDAVEKTLDGWDGKVWPDDWRRWFIAVDDVYFSREATPAQKERAAAISRRS